MAIITSLFTGVSGLNANGQMLSVIGDNIANVNTIGFKGSRMSFGDILSQSVSGSGGNSQVGRGAMMTSISPMFIQGSFQNTGSALDLAIDGDGFFVVNDNGTRAYTRAGQFTLDDSGYIVNPEGARLQAYLADAAGNITATIGDMQMLGAQTPAFATTNASLGVNLDATAAVTTWAGVPPAAGTYNNSTTVTVFDSLGTAHQVNVYFSKTGANAWDAHYVYQDGGGAFVQAGVQAMTFNADGTLNTGATGGPFAFNWGGGANAGAVTMDLTGSTQFSSVFAVGSIDQNGYPSGALRSVLVSEDGTITGVFTNGQSRSLGQVALARFMAPTELAKLGRNLFGESSESGQPVIGAPTTSGMGRTLSNTLELSNVDLAEEFVKLISAQRGFQANTKIITTTDELLNELIAIKR